MRSAVRVTAKRMDKVGTEHTRTMKSTREKTIVTAFSADEHAAVRRLMDEGGFGLGRRAASLSDYLRTRALTAPIADPIDRVTLPALQSDVEALAAEVTAGEVSPDTLMRILQHLGEMDVYASQQRVSWGESTAEDRTIRVSFRVSAEEDVTIAWRAAACRLPVAEFVRATALRRRLRHADTVLVMRPLLLRLARLLDAMRADALVTRCRAAAKDLTISYYGRGEVTADVIEEIAHAS